MTCALYNLFSILIFPGVLFLFAFSLAAEYIDRKLCAKLQNRVGPPWFQPFADFVKLCAKQDVVPELADSTVFRLMPLVAFATTVTAFLYIPIWGAASLYPFEGDLIVVLYLLTVPTMTFFLAGWYSGSTYSLLGAVRSITQLFAYEIPLFLCVLAPALLAGTWSLSQMTIYYGEHWFLAIINLVIGLPISLVAMLGKLEKVPFDIPEAETEIVAGSFTEYSGRLLAMFRLAIDVEMVVGASLLAAVFLPFGLQTGSVIAGFILYLLKVLIVIALLSVMRTVMARMRIDQMISFCWKVVAPIAFAMLLIDLILKGVISR